MWQQLCQAFARGAGGGQASPTSPQNTQLLGGWMKNV